MNKKARLLLQFLPAIFLFFAWGNFADAATMYLLPDQRRLSIGQEFNVDIKIDTSDSSSSINSAQATIQFPVSILKVGSVDKQNSAFGFWLEDPVISNDSGTVHFIGGSIKGVAGSAIQVLRVKFKTTGAGTADLKIADGAVTAADGKGTNILSGVKGVSVAVGTNVLPSAPAPAEGVEQPQIIQRTAVAATGLPVKPVLRVPFYPDESRWYDRVGDTIVLWDLPADVTQVAARIGHGKDNIVGTAEKDLSNGKNFGILQEGIWYVKVQFKNSIGWGEPAYYKISIDTTVPSPFDIKIDNAASDNPTPIIKFESSDSLSGIAGYDIAVDGKEIAQTTSTEMKLPVQAPGKHSLAVKASDFAENSVQDSIGFEILALPAPQIEFITQAVSQGDFVFAMGKGIPGGFVDVSVSSGDARKVFQGTAAVDNEGSWDITIREPLGIGQYAISLVSRDNRGATSLTISTQKLTVKAKSIISFGFIELGWFEILIIVILLVATGASLWSRQYIIGQQKRGRYNVLVSQDVEKLSDLLSGNIKDLSRFMAAKNTGNEDPQFNYLIGRMSENVEKFKKYLKQEVGKLK